MTKPFDANTSMEPLDVWRVIWKNRWAAAPVLLATVVACAYVFAYGPRVYESTASVAIVAPDVYQENEEEAPRGNPFLRSPDPSLITSALVTRMNSPAVAEGLEEQGVTGDYRVGQVGGSSFMIDATALGGTPDEASHDAQLIMRSVNRQLTRLQSIDGTGEEYMYEALTVASPGTGVERFASRLRATIMTLIAGVIATFVAITIGRTVSQRRSDPASMASGYNRSDLGLTAVRRSVQANDPAESASARQERPVGRRAVGDK